MRTRATIHAFMLASASALAASAHAQDAAPATVSQVALADTTAPEAIIVTGRRTNEVSREQQKNAINLINIQSAEDIVKYPDFNAAESLSRIPGVSISADTGEGRFVVIRGIDSNLNGTQFGGVTLLNTQPGGTSFGGGGRAVELDTIPIGAVDQLLVRKTGLPDQEAEGLGGSVDIIPRTAQGIKRPFVEGTIGGGYQVAHGHAGVYVGELTAATRFGPNQAFGILLDGSYHEDGRGFDDVEPAPLDADAITRTNTVLDAVDLRRYNYNRRRFGFGGELTYNPTPQSHYYIRADDAGYTERVNRQILNYSNLGADANGDTLTGINNIYSAPQAAAALSLRDEQETAINFVTAIGGHNDLGKVILDYQGSYTSATYHRDYDFNSGFDTSAPAFTVNYNTAGGIDGLPSLTPIGFNPGDPTQYTLTSFRNTTEGAHDAEYAGRIDVTVPIRLLGTDESIKVGGKLRLRDKRDTTNNTNYGTPATPLTQVLGGGPYNNFYNNTYAIGYSPDYLKIRALFQGNPSLFPITNVNGRRGTAARDARNFFNDTENVYAGYFEYRGTFGKLGVLAGLRVENTDGTYRGINVTTPDRTSPPTLSDTSRKSSYTDVFPTVQLRYDFTDKLIARVTYSTGISRPGFLQLKSGPSVDVGARTVNVGNPDLKPTTANSFDVTAEYYLPHSGIISVGFFDKEFENYSLRRVQRNVNYLGDGTPFTVSSFANVANSYARGVEAEYVQRFTFLPGLLSGLGFSGNVTYVDSRIKIRDLNTSGTIDEFSRLPGTSELTWNVAGFYEAHGVIVRISAQNVSPSIFGVGGATGADIFTDDKTQVDLSASYTVNPHATLYFTAKNLTDGALRYYEGFQNRPVQREFYDVSYEAGLRFHF